MSTYYLHSKLQLYQLFGNNPPSDNYSPPPNVNSIYGLQKKRMRQEYMGLRGTAAEAQELQKFLNLTQDMGRENSQNSSQDQIISRLRQEIGDQIDVTVTNTLGVSQEDKRNNAALNEKRAKLNSKIQQVFTPGKKHHTISRVEFERVLQQLEKVYNSIPVRRLNEAQKKFKFHYLRILKYIETLKAENSEIYKKYNFGEGLRVLDTENISARQFINSLNAAQSMVTFGDLSQKIGSIAEMFGAATAYMYFNKSTAGYEDVVNDFINKGLTKNKSIKVTGGDTSSKVFTDKLGNQFVNKKNFTDNGNNIYSLNATQDKVDFSITVPDSRSSLNFSVKNYASDNRISLLSGNIYPILDEYPDFLYHFLNTINLLPKTSQADLLYQAAKYTVGVKALIGGVRALGDNGQIIRTEQADYLMVNTHTRKKGIRVYPARQICQQIEKNINLLEFGHEFNQPMNLSKLDAFDNRFMNMHVYLHLSALKNSLKSKA